MTINRVAVTVASGVLYPLLGSVTCVGAAVTNVGDCNHCLECCDPRPLLGSASIVVVKGSVIIVGGCDH